MIKKWLIIVVVSTLMPVWASANELDYPNRPVKIVVPVSVGGGGDYIARAWSNELSQRLGQPVVIDNRGGAGTVIGTQLVANATADGYTLLLTNQALAANPYLRANLPYETPGSFAPVAKVISYGMGFAATKEAPFSHIQGLIAYGRENPYQVTVATGGKGSAADLAADQFTDATGIKWVKVPFKGSGEAAGAVASGHVDLVITGMSQLKPLLDGDLIKLLATTGAQRMASWPDVPTVSEQGLPGFNAVVWWGLLAPAQTPAVIIEKLNQALKTSLADPGVKNRLDVINGVVNVTTPTEFMAFIKAEMRAFARLTGADGKPWP